MPLSTAFSEQVLTPCFVPCCFPLQIKKLCLAERQERTHAASAAAKSGQPHLPPALETRGGRTPEMRMASSIMVGITAHPGNACSLGVCVSG